MAPTKSKKTPAPASDSRQLTLPMLFAGASRQAPSPQKVNTKPIANVSELICEKASVKRIADDSQHVISDSAVAASRTFVNRPKLRQQASANSVVGFDDTPNQRFTISDANNIICLSQYHHIYLHRLKQLTPRIHERIREADILCKVGSIEDLIVSSGAVVYHQKDGKSQMTSTNRSAVNAAKKRRSDDAQEALSSEEMWVVGNLFKLMPNRPNILRDLSAAAPEMALQPVQQRFLTVNDQLWLEDSYQKVQLVDLDIERYMCGQTVGVRGRLDSRGLLHVSRIIEPGTPMRIEKPVGLSRTIIAEKQSQNTYVVFICGFGLSGRKLSGENPNLGEVENLDQFRRRFAGLELFFNALNADAVSNNAEDAENREILRNTYAVILAGNMINYPRPGYRDELHHMAQYLLQKFEIVSTQSIYAVDRLLSSIPEKLPVFSVMPGAEDPTFHLLPQQPLSYALIARESAPQKPQNLRFRTNPYEFFCLGRHFLGTSGQNVSDAVKNCSEQDPLEILRYMLKCGHMAPTAPNTLPTYTDPKIDSDPFVLDVVPDVFFAGNQPSFGAKLVECDGVDVVDVTRESGGKKQKCLLLSLPKFGESGGCVVAVDVNDLSVKQMFFMTDKDEIAVEQ